MFRAIERIASLAVLSLLCVAFLPACGSGGDTMSDRRAEAELDSSGEPVAPTDDDAFWGDESEKASEAAVSSATSDSDDDGFGDDDDDFGDVDVADDFGDDDDDVVEVADERTARGDRSGGRYENIFDAMAEDDKVAIESAKFYAQQGDAAFANLQYEDAADLYRQAKDKDPNNQEIRDKWNRTLVLIGERSTELIVETEFEGRKIHDQQVVLEVQTSLEKSRKAIDAGDLDKARRFAQVALATVSSNPNLMTDDSRVRAKNLLKEIDRLELAAKRARRAENSMAADKLVEIELKAEEDRKKAQVQKLLHNARRQIKMRDYVRAKDTCESILAIDPDNRVAMFWRNTSQDQIGRQRRLRLFKARAEEKRASEVDFRSGSIPTDDVDWPSESDWHEVRKRASTKSLIAFDVPEWIKSTKNRLETTMIPNINFEDALLEEVIDTFRDIAGINILLDGDIDGASDEFKVSQKIKNLSAMTALKNILAGKGLGFSYRDGRIEISSKDNVKEETVFDVYNVSDLLTRIKDFSAPEIRLRSSSDAAGDSPLSFTDDVEEDGDNLEPEQLVELIKDTTGGDEFWLDEYPVEFSQGQLFVTAPREHHIKLRGVLESLRKDSDLFVIIEARFIDVFDDFLEDIGIDSRALGIVNNMGTAFGNVINDNSTGGNDLGIVQQGDQDDVFLVQGLDRWAGRVQHIIDGFSGTIRGDRLSGGNGIGGGTFQATWLEPFQANVILRMVQEKQDVRQLTAPVVTAHNNERVYVSVITQRAYIADYELVSGGTGFAIIEVADPVVQTFQEGVILDVDPTVSHDKKYVTLDVRPTLATLIGGVISTINISLGSFTNVAFQVPIGIPQIALQQSFTSVTVPNGGTVLLGGFKSMMNAKFVSYLPILGQIPILKNLARRKATIEEKRSLVILLSARIVDLRGKEAERFNAGE